MSTRSELYHCFGLGVVECTKTDYSAGKTMFHVRHPRERIVCPVCHGPDIRCRGTVERTFRLVPIGGRPTFAVFSVQRVECLECGIVRQEHLPFAEPYRRYTRSFARYALELSRIATVKDVATHLGVSWGLVREIQQQALEKEVRTMRLDSLRRIGIDELAVGKGHRYVTVVIDLDSGAVVFVGDGKGAESVKPFLRKLKNKGVMIEAVAMDMGRAYPLAVAELFPGVDLVYDRFHVIKLMNEKLTVLRREMHREARDKLQKDVLKGSRWLLLKNPENLSDERDERRRLQEALALNEPLATAYYMKEELRQFWCQQSEDRAAALLESWIRRAQLSGISVLKTMAKTLQSCRRGLLNWYRHPISNGPLEGLNNKAQTMKRQAYGYRNIEFYKLKLMTLHQKKYALVG